MIEKMTSDEAKVASYLRDHGDMFDGGDKDSRAELATQWMDSFDDPFECSEWMDAGFWCPQTACAVSYLGIRPADVAALCDPSHIIPLSTGDKVNSLRQGQTVR